MKTYKNTYNIYIYTHREREKFQNNIIPILLYILGSHRCQENGTSQTLGSPLEIFEKIRTETRRKDSKPNINKRIKIILKRFIILSKIKSLNISL
jgi:hypothetical protein